MRFDLLFGALLQSALFTFTNQKRKTCHCNFCDVYEPAANKRNCCIPCKRQKNAKCGVFVSFFLIKQKLCFLKSILLKHWLYAIWGFIGSLQTLINPSQSCLLSFFLCRFNRKKRTFLPFWWLFFWMETGSPGTQGPAGAPGLPGQDVSLHSIASYVTYDFHLRHMSLFCLTPGQGRASRQAWQSRA